MFKPTTRTGRPRPFPILLDTDDALAGLTPFAADALVAQSLRTDGVDLAFLYERVEDLRRGHTGLRLGGAR